MFGFIIIAFIACAKNTNEYDYQTIKGERGTSKECYKQGEKLFCLVEVEWYAIYEGED